MYEGEHQQNTQLEQKNEQQEKYLQAKSRIQSIEETTLSRTGASAFDVEDIPLEPETVALLENDLREMAVGFTIPEHYQETVKQFQRITEFQAWHKKGDTHKAAEQAAIKVIAENIDAIQKGINKEELSKARASLELLGQLTKSEDKELKKKSAAEVLKDKDILSAIMKDKNERTRCVKLTQKIFVSGTDEQCEEMNQIIKQGLVTGDQEYQSIFLTDMLTTKSLYSRHAEDLVSGILETKYGVNGKRCISEWMDTSGQQLDTFIQKNIQSMEDIEKELPGACQILWKEFGIVNFNRYPESILIKQVKEREKQGEYGIILYPRSDYNTAFHDKEVNDQDYMSKIIEQTQGNTPLRIYECGNKRELIESLIKSNRRNGKISFAVIAGHGTDQSIHLGNYNSSLKVGKETRTAGNNIYAVDIVDYIADEGWSDEPYPVAKKLNRFFVDNPTVLLWSCSTGKGQDNLAQKISLLGATVVAPDQDSDGIKDISVTKTDNRFSFDVLYGGANAKTYKNGQLLS